MSNSTELFTGTEDRVRVLTDILNHGPAVPGLTLVAHVDRATLAVLEVRSLPTLPAVIDQNDYFDDEAIHELQPGAPRRGDRLRTRPRLGRCSERADHRQIDHGGLPPRAPDFTPTESQYFFGWRYSNHLTAAFHGDVFVVTPTGWANLLGDWGGTSPALTVPVPSRRYWDDL